MQAKKIVISGAMILTLQFGLVLSASAGPGDRLQPSDLSGKDIDQLVAMFAEKRAEQEIRNTKPNPEIGMHKSKIRDETNWGAPPDKLNTTIDADGVHEQWIYDGRGELHFIDDKLISIKY